MVWNESFGSDHERTVADAGEFDPALDWSRPRSEECFRLVSAFFSIPQRAVREAIIVLVSTLSTADGQRE
jgi:hypothetical protein